MLTRRNFVDSGSSLGVAGVSWAPAKPSLPRNVGHGVMMLNAACSDAGTPNVFEPAILRIATGDRVTFLPTDGGHNTASKRGMIPEGALPWNGAIDETVEVEFIVPGIYGYLCLTHYEMGMVGLIVVGDDISNLAEVRKARHPGKARKAFRQLIDQLEN